MDSNFTQTQTQSPAAFVVQDVSPRVHHLMQIIDRLPPGTYEITIQKQEVSRMDWGVDIVRTEKIQHVNLARNYRPE